MRKAEKPDLPQFEAEMLKTWDQENAFQESLKQRQKNERFRFFDGPPFTSGEPHYGHIEQSALKDAIARYKTMRGYYVPRRLGYDTHGLPVEYLVEKELGFSNKQDIIKHGVGKFIEACRAVVFKHRADFERMYHRIGRWADFKDAYATLDADYIESVWWVFAQIYQKGLVYQGFKSLPYCPRCATPLSNFEMNDGYRDDVMDPSLYVKLKVKGEERYLVAWTTTPWSLPGNVALAVNPGAKYLEVEQEGERLIVAAGRVKEALEEGYKEVKTLRGQELAGLSYEPLFRVKDASHPDLFKVWEDASVELEEGTGILHIAPAFGETDLEFGQRHDLPVLSTIDANGRVVEGIGLPEAEGRFFKEADRIIIADLTKRGLVLSAEDAPHTYPFCWRCETPLLYYAITTWFVEVTKLREQLVKAGEKTNWIPRHVKGGRFIKWLEGAKDWAISRNRFWGAPIPVWRCENGHDTVVGSVAELEKLSGRKITELHKPDIDEVKLKCGECGKEAKRIEEVFDCWFESGSMPYGQDHYPFERKAEFEASFPADFIAEAVEQVHLWFYTLHVLAVALFNKPAYLNVIASGLILAQDGRKLSKRLGNFPPVEELFQKFGADSVRFFLLSSPLMNGEPTRLDEDSIRDIQRNLFLTLWNSYSFFTTYAEIDNWEPGNSKQETGRDSRFPIPDSQNILDQWLLARLNQTISEVTKQADKYRISSALRPIGELVDDLSNWYVRRSRRRFWKSGNDKDKEQAHQTLYLVLVRLCQLLAPWAPFMADKMHRELSGWSVHLADWPKASILDPRFSTLVLEQMELARRVAQEGLAKRGEEKLKVRQPLSELSFKAEAKLPDVLLNVIAEEVNVKTVQQKGRGELTVTLNTKITQELKREGLAREVIRHIQQFRKELDLKVDDRIELGLSSSDAELSAAIADFSDLISRETLAKSLSDNEAGEQKEVLVDAQKILISIRISR